MDGRIAQLEQFAGNEVQKINNVEITFPFQRNCLAAPLAGRFVSLGNLLATETKRPASGAAKHIIIRNRGVISMPFPGSLHPPAPVPHPQSEPSRVRLRRSS